MRNLVAVLFGALATGLPLAGCGGDTARNAPSKHAAQSSRQSSQGGSSHRASSDGDGDGDKNDDENDIRFFGDAASVVARLAIAGTIEHYHAATAAKDGHRACALLTKELAEGIAEQAPARTGGSNACSVALESLLSHGAGPSDAALAKVDVVSVRVAGDEARALVRLPTGEERYLPLTRQGREWKIGALADMGMV
jgi:hypothetical protein